MGTVVHMPKKLVIKFSGQVMCSHSGTDSCITNDSEQDISMKVPASSLSNNCNAESMFDSQKPSKRKMGPGLDFCGTEDSEPDTKTTAATSAGCKKRKSETVLNAQRLMRRKMGHGGDTKLDSVKVASVDVGSKNCKPAYMVDDSQRCKSSKMDRALKLKCGLILRELSSHQYGWVFSEPVDPVALKIPDYFAIISHPMDLGTIKSKLENNKYSCPEEFASDVNLTFSNAMRYNPPIDDVYKWAKFLDSMFRNKWKLAVRKWNLESSGVEQGISEHEGEVKKNAYSEKPSSNAATEVKKSTTPEEKERLLKEAKSLVDGKIPENLCNTLKNSKILRLMEGKFKFDVKDVDDSTWLELRRCLKSIKAAKVALEKTDNTGRCFLPAEVAHRGASGSVDCSKPSMSSSSSKCRSCGGMRCHCGNPHKSTSGSPNDKSIGRQRPAPRVDAVKQDLLLNATTSNQGVKRKDLPPHATNSDSVAKKALPSQATSLDSDAVKKDVRAHAAILGSNDVRKGLPNHTRVSGSSAVKKDLPTPAGSNSNVVRNNVPTHETSSNSDVAMHDFSVCATTSGQDSHGIGSVKDEAKTSTCSAFSPPLSTATPGEGYAWLDDQSSLEKSQRAAMLKSRFADTILKAHGKSDPKKLQEEKERLERLQREEEARNKEKLEQERLHLQKQIEKARQDCRAAVEMVERTAMADDNLMSLKELEILCGCPPSRCLYVDSFRRELHRTGWFLKEDNFLEDMDDGVVDDDREEGEI